MLNCAVFLNVKMLEAEEDTTAGGAIIMVFTDGEETLDFDLHPTVEEIGPTVLEKKAIVHGILMAGETDDSNLIKLAVESGGDFCIFEDSGTGGTDFYQCMWGLLEGLADYTTEVR